MASIDKLKNRLMTRPKDFTYSEARTLLTNLGFIEYNKGKTSGSRVKFYRERDKAIILLHKPHPGDIIKDYAVKDLVIKLKELGEL